MYRDVPWNPRSYRRTPPRIRHELRRLGDVPLQVGATFSVTPTDVAAGQYRHLGLELDQDISSEVVQVLPPPNMGFWSRTNLYGYRRPRPDLPMTTKTYSKETPNWGDWTKGSHEVSWDREVYQREIVVAKHLPLNRQLIGRRTDGSYVLRCWTNEVLTAAAETFEADLLYNLNLLQENTGHCGVFHAGTTPEQYLETLRVEWIILPPGDRDQNIATILSRRPVSDTVRARLVERYDFLAKLRPRHWVEGLSGFAHYFGALFDDDLVVLDNVEYGNAAYVMGANWQELSKLSRTELRRRAEMDFSRIPHTSTWKRQLAAIIRRHMPLSAHAPMRRSGRPWQRKGI